MYIKLKDNHIYEFEEASSPIVLKLLLIDVREKKRGISRELRLNLATIADTDVPELKKLLGEK